MQTKHFTPKIKINNLFQTNASQLWTINIKVKLLILWWVVERGTGRKTKQEHGLHTNGNLYLARQVVSNGILQVELVNSNALYEDFTVLTQKGLTNDVLGTNKPSLAERNLCFQKTYKQSDHTKAMQPFGVFLSTLSQRTVTD